MKQYLVLALAITLGFSAVAQKKQLRTAKKALVKGNYETVSYTHLTLPTNLRV